jgi:hypothetical protein
MSEISFEQMVNHLKDMFTEWDKESLGAILEANGYHIERTIEACLSMNSGLSSTSDASSTPAEAPRTGMPAPTSASGAPRVSKAAPAISSVTSTGPESRGAPAPAPAPSSSSSSPASASNKRGSTCKLPETFLRPPLWRNPTGSRPQDTAILPDEELARMLQNEMFQRQVQAQMGYAVQPSAGQRGYGTGYDVYGYADRPAGSTRQPPSGLTRQQQEQWRLMQMNNDRAYGNTGAGAGSGSGSGSGTYNDTTGTGNPHQSRAERRGSSDLGIMSSLSSMGEGMKRRLSAMAQSFKGNADRDARRNQLRQGGGDDDVQTINFHSSEGSSASEMTPLNRQTSNISADDDDEMHNPLLRQTANQRRSQQSTSSRQNTSNIHRNTDASGNRNETANLLDIDNGVEL